MEWISFVAGLLGFAAAGGFMLWKKESAAREKAEAERDKLRADSEQLRRDEAAATARANAAVQNESKLQDENNSLRERERNSAMRVSEMETKLKNADKTVETLTEVRDSMKEQFKNLSETVLEEKGAKFGAESKKILAPLKEDLEKFRAQVNAIHTKDAEDRSALKQQIESLQNNAAEYGKSADNLARALKGDSKTQGDWGEIMLANLLENSGLREGREYETQKTMIDEDGNRLRPDVVIKLPGDKCLIVDSKVSLRDYHAANAAEPNSEAEKIALAKHLAAVKKHVADLSGKHYAKLRGANAPDFVFMFMPVEPAFFAALRTDTNLFSHAYDKKIILCAPTTLMATLRTVQRIWQLERQNRNADEIAKRGGLLYDKFLGLLNDLGTIHDAFQKAQTGFAAATDKIKHGRGNLIWQAQQLYDLGVETKHKRLRDPEEPKLTEK